MSWDASELIRGASGIVTRNREHGLSLREDGTAEMMYTNEAPWHALGTRLDGPATSKEAIVAAGMDWPVETEPLFTGDGTAVNARAVRRMIRQLTEAGESLAPGDILGVVSPGWRAIQNVEAFAFADALAAEKKIVFHTAGVIGRGERVWMMGQIPGHIRVGKTDDIVEKYLLFSNCHDGTGALRVLWTPERVVCRNTLALALARGEGAGVTIRHTGEIGQKLAEAQRVLGLAERFYDDLGPMADALARYQPRARQVEAYFAALYPDPEDPEVHARALENARKTRDVLGGLFENGEGQDIPGVRGSAWCAYHAVTEFLDHVRPASKVRPSTRRLESLWFGQDAKIKRDAWALAAEMAGVN